MFKTKFKILLSLLLILLLVTPFCFATNETTTENLQLTTTNATSTKNTKQSTLDDVQIKNTDGWIKFDLFKIEDTINITKSDVYDGNAFIIGKDVTISGDIGGDLFIIADKLTINGGYVYSSIFALANEINITDGNGKKGRLYDLYAICNNFNLGANTIVSRDIKLAASNVHIAGEIGRNAYIAVENLSFAENAGNLIGGDLNYTSSKSATIPSGVVKGKVNFTEAKPVENTKKSISSYVFNLVEALLFTFVVALVLIWLAPKFVENLGKTTGLKILAALGIGLITPICSIIVCALLLVSLVGLPISICIALINFVLLFAGKAITSIYFAKLLANKMNSDGNIKFALCSLLTTVILWIIAQIPVLGSIVSSIATIFGMGLVLINIFRKKDVAE